MSENNTGIYQFLPQLFLRAPYYSFNGYDLSRLPEVLQEQAFRNAVWLASPEFYRLLEINGFDFDRLIDKEKHTLYKYYNRMCFRPTPFGSFASFTLLEWGNGEQVKLAPNDKAILHLLPDQQLLYQLRNALGIWRTTGDLMLSPSLYRLENVFRYYKSTVGEKGRYTFSLEAIAAVKFNAGLFSFLGRARVPLAGVIGWIMDHGECTEGEAKDYIRFLLDEHALYGDALGHIICPEDPVRNGSQPQGWYDFWKACRSVPLSNTFSLAALSAQLQKIAAGSSNSNPVQPFYAALERRIESGGPDKAEQTELSGAVRLLELLCIQRQPEDLSRFIREFRERFDREKVPLLIALDRDAGLPYGGLEPSNPNPGILENLHFQEFKKGDSRAVWTPVQQLLLCRWTGDALRDPWAPLQIGDEEILELQNRETDGLRLPQTLALMYRNTGEHLVIESAGGVSGAALIGRFSCFNEQVHGFCRTLADQEVNANPGVAFADIGQLSDTHVDNINRRRPVYPYEIPVNVCSAQPEETQLWPGDLLLSLQGDELILESLRLGKRVIPRLATAYNFRNNHLPVFRLLCDLQFQGLRAGLSFDLEVLFPGLSFYPRVSCGRVVLSPAKWNFKTPEINALTGKGPAELWEALQTFRRKHHIPRHISMGEHDQQLVFDLVQPAEARFFLQCLKGMKTARLQEYLLPDRSVLAGKKPLAGQMIAFLAHGENRYKASSPVNKAVTRAEDRNFLMGSNWLYLKIFCNPLTADTILLKVIAPFVRHQRKLIKNWFFIRYTDEGYHLRLRFQADENHLGALLVALRKKMMSGEHDKLVRDYQGDTYRREIERYSLRLMPQIERFFCSGSDLAAWVIRAREANKISWTEFELALLTADRMISCFLPADRHRMAYLDAVTANFMKEFRAGKQLKTGMDTKFREMKPVIAELLNGGVHLKELGAFLELLKELYVLTGGYSPEKKAALLADLVHMQLNRTFTVQQRQQELLVYYCLQKYTLSRMARDRTAGQPS